MGLPGRLAQSGGLMTLEALQPGPQGLRPLLPAFSPFSVLPSRPLITFLWGSTLHTPTCSDLCRHLAVLKGVWCAGP